MKKSAFLLALLFSGGIHADVLSVADAEMLINAVKQLKTLQAQLSTLQSQNQTLQQTQKLMQGHYGYGSLSENSSLTDWQHSAKSWESMLNPSSSQDALSKLSKQLAHEFPLQSGGTIFKNAHGSENAKLYDLLSKTTLASRAGHSLSYARVDDELLMLESLQKEIEKTPNQKASLDLLARIQIEQAKLLAYKLKSDTVNQELASLQSQQEISDAKWASEFLKWH